MFDFVKYRCQSIPRLVLFYKSAVKYKYEYLASMHMGDELVTTTDHSKRTRHNLKYSYSMQYRCTCMCTSEVVTVKWYFVIVNNLVIVVIGHLKHHVVNWQS